MWSCENPRPRGRGAVARRFGHRPGRAPAQALRNAVCSCLEALEDRRLFAGPVSITIGAGETYELTGDITDFTTLTIQGAGPNSVLDGNGFQIVNGNLAGNVTISNVRLKDLGRSWVNPTTGAPT